MSNLFYQCGDKIIINFGPYWGYKFVNIGNKYIFTSPDDNVIDLSKRRSFIDDTNIEWEFYTLGNIWSISILTHPDISDCPKGIIIRGYKNRIEMQDILYPPSENEFFVNCFSRDTIIIDNIGNKSELVNVKFQSQNCLSNSPRYFMGVFNISEYLRYIQTSGDSGILVTKQDNDYYLLDHNLGNINIEYQILYLALSSEWRQLLGI